MDRRGFLKRCGWIAPALTIAPSVLLSEPSILPNRVYHFCAVHCPESFPKLYIDGVLQTDVELPGIINAADPEMELVTGGTDVSFNGGETLSKWFEISEISP